MIRKAVSFCLASLLPFLAASSRVQAQSMVDIFKQQEIEKLKLRPRCTNINNMYAEKSSRYDIESESVEYYCIEGSKLIEVKWGTVNTLPFETPFMDNSYQNYWTVEGKGLVRYYQYVGEDEVSEVYRDLEACQGGKGYEAGEDNCL